MAEATRGQILLDIETHIHTAETTMSETLYILALTKLMFKAKELVAFEKAQLNLDDRDLDSIGRGTFESEDGSPVGNENVAAQTIGYHRQAACEAYGILVPESYTVG